MKLCECGCGKEVKAWSKRWQRPLRFVHGHNWRGKSRGGMTLEQKLGNSIKCKCGCGETITQYRIKADGNRFKVQFQVGHMYKAEQNHFWKGGLTDLARRFKQSGLYRSWRKAVFERDNFTCQECGVKNQKGLGRTVEMHPDHIKPFALFPELRTELSNGRTLCIDCHRKTDTYGIKLVHLMRGVN